MSAQAVVSFASPKILLHNVTPAEKCNSAAWKSLQETHERPKSRYAEAKDLCSGPKWESFNRRTSAKASRAAGKLKNKYSRGGGERCVVRVRAFVRGEKKLGVSFTHSCLLSAFRAVARI